MERIFTKKQNDGFPSLKNDKSASGYQTVDAMFKIDEPAFSAS